MPYLSPTRLREIKHSIMGDAFSKVKFISDCKTKKLQGTDLLDELLTLLLNNHIQIITGTISDDSIVPSRDDILEIFIGLFNLEINVYPIDTSTYLLKLIFLLITGRLKVGSAVDLEFTYKYFCCINTGLQYSVPKALLQQHEADESIENKKPYITDQFIEFSADLLEKIYINTQDTITNATDERPTLIYKCVSEILDILMKLTYQRSINRENKFFTIIPLILNMFYEKYRYALDFKVLYINHLLPSNIKTPNLKVLQFLNPYEIEILTKTMILLSNKTTKNEASFMDIDEYSRLKVFVKIFTKAIDNLELKCAAIKYLLTSAEYDGDFSELYLLIYQHQEVVDNLPWWFDVLDILLISFRNDTIMLDQFSQGILNNFLMPYFEERFFSLLQYRQHTMASYHELAQLFELLSLLCSYNADYKFTLLDFKFPFYNAEELLQKNKKTKKRLRLSSACTESNGGKELQKNQKNKTLLDRINKIYQDADSNYRGTIGDRDDTVKDGVVTGSHLVEIIRNGINGHVENLKKALQLPVYDTDEAYPCLITSELTKSMLILTKSLTRSASSLRKYFKSKVIANTFLNLVSSEIDLIFYFKNSTLQKKLLKSEVEILAFALGIISNFSLEFSPLQPFIFSNGSIFIGSLNKIFDLFQDPNVFYFNPDVILNNLWVLRNRTFESSVEVRVELLSQISLEKILKYTIDPNWKIQEQCFYLLANLTCSSRKLINMLLKCFLTETIKDCQSDVTESCYLFEFLASKMKKLNVNNEVQFRILLSILYILANISAINEHKRQMIVENDDLMNCIKDILSRNISGYTYKALNLACLRILSNLVWSSHQTPGHSYNNTYINRNEEEENEEEENEKENGNLSHGGYIFSTTNPARFNKNLKSRNNTDTEDLKDRSSILVEMGFQPIIDKYLKSKDNHIFEAAKFIQAKLIIPSNGNVSI
ncbi:glucose-induced degradation complex subunit VID28 SCDLUD_002469 [Saccharomycodes ludwigii]|uniref:glucose-induced degradation complex subunit VID28 n=1 Tax=Saccharomycodes ludwigii TaxID=36035 RepID=UPI001E88C4DF|nr:hypothetical protein SCDLUD_002469 [Saccharomycodes ludwigii]KAH3901004.1 hypothetical protein SCDLUD_002469 [Saccharomycodes ludwigii]